MASVVYICCAILSLACAYMLLKGYLRNKFRLLFWSGIGFTGFAVNNFLLYIDLVVVKQVDLSTLRTMPALIGMLLMIYGLISDTIGE